MFNPKATYRIQFHKDFNFESFEPVISYLQKLGVKTVYASPVFKATPGSTHGYDVTDPLVINPEIGSVEQLDQIKEKLRKTGISWLQDIVPNHMAFHPSNEWLTDVLEKGPQSKYVSFFDITWNSELYRGRLMVPFLGAPLEDIIKNKELTIDSGKHGLFFRYYENIYPLHLRSYLSVLKPLIKESDAIKDLSRDGNEILKLEDPEAFTSRFSEFKKRFKSLLKNAEGDLMKSSIAEINNSAKKLQSISDEQVYQLCFWQETNSQINFRRFFTINGLICLNIQNPEVFKEYHTLIKKLYDEKIIDGLRIDHVDGMYDPAKYLDELRKLVGDEAFISVEKILESEEELPEQWPVQGTTGYDFLSWVNNLFSNSKSYNTLSKFYLELTGDNRTLDERIREKKEKILYTRLAGELENLYRLFLELELLEKAESEKVNKEDLKKAIAEFLILCPVYRYYSNVMPLDDKEAALIRKILKKVNKKNPRLKETTELLENTLLYKPLRKNKQYNQNVAHFYRRLMQFTGPLMAKGVEDTLMYTYSCFIGHNEVGDSPHLIKILPLDFHNKMVERQKKWPLTMNATSTHDTKRGEDVRMRLSVLTDLYQPWVELVQKWRKMNQVHKTNGHPDANDEYFIYQTLLGAYPMPGEAFDNVDERLAEYIPKALREAKRHSNWAEPDEAYEKAAVDFALALLKDKKGFMKSFLPFHKIISDYGIINSLSQLILKYTCPGIPDLYQGCELWDLSLVDPDNRRAVDYELRNKFLQDISRIEGKNNFISTLWKSRYNGKIKLWLTKVLLRLRDDTALDGAYIPLKVKGKYMENLLAYCRKNGDSWILVVIPLNLASVSNMENEAIRINWKNTRIKLPKDAPQQWTNHLRDNLQSPDRTVKINDLFDDLPFFVGKGQSVESGKRTAGILMHITSLPSRLGVGDMGPEAYKFADFLKNGRQSFWQILPLNPTGAEVSYSPYSSDSSMAGNTLLISPEELVKDKLLQQKDITPFVKKLTGTAQFKTATKAKEQLLDRAFENFKKSKNQELQNEFDSFKTKESFWLKDYALFVVLKENFKNKPWYEWPELYKKRDRKALKEFSNTYTEAVNKIMWLQFIFSRQWKRLKSYCNRNGIKMFGDLPFYISHDSVDVWANPEIFAVDEEGNMTGVAGVPPDYFNSNGQLWGMPVFNWKMLKKQNYRWWIQRIKKNMELYDLLRLDHFRAFSDFWEVPAGEETAINGQWKTGPGRRFFKELKKKFSHLPFIAEDLGDINQAVYDLRDSFNLPGMKVVQFAFGDDLPHSPHIPHNYSDNYVAYTGTHDNNTTLGWYKKDTGKTEKNNLNTYSGFSVNEKNVHKILIQQIYASVAKIAIVPVQDILGLDEKSRMNMPATTKNNWSWQLLPNQLKAAHIKWLRELTEIYNR